tara:strand:+ start:224 stop:349 length:126 start_codon:yes stop_codon:yes gene_type:complete
MKIVRKPDNVTTSWDYWYDIEKIEYYNDGEMIIYYEEKTND